jgi:hypothetical protein
LQDLTGLLDILNNLGKHYIFLWDLLFGPLILTHNSWHSNFIPCYLKSECVNSKKWGKHNSLSRQQISNWVCILECESYKNQFFLSSSPYSHLPWNNFEWNMVCKLKCEPFIHLIFYFLLNLSTLVALIHVYFKYKCKLGHIK